MSKVKTKNLTTKKGLHITIRSPDENDAPQVQELINSVIGERKYQVTEPGEFTMSIDDQEKWILKMNSAPHDVVIVAEFHGRIIGMLDFHQNSKRKRLKHTGAFGMSVVTEYRDHGVGQALIDELFYWAQGQKQVEKICLSVFSNNTRALQLYKKNGFHEEGCRIREIKISADEYLDEVLMYKNVKHK